MCSNTVYTNFSTLEKVRLNNHRKNVKLQASILAYKHFSEKNHNFQQHAEFTLIEQNKKQTTTKETRTLLKRTENVWVLGF